MATNTTIFNEEALKKAIEKELTTFITERYEQMKKDFIKKIEEDKAKHIAGMSLHLMKSVSMETFGDKITIAIRTINE